MATLYYPSTLLWIQKVTILFIQYLYYDGEKFLLNCEKWQKFIIYFIILVYIKGYITLVLSFYLEMLLLNTFNVDKIIRYCGVAL